MVAAFADLEFGLVWDSSHQSFEVDLRFTNTSNVDQVPESRPERLNIDLTALRDLVNDDQAYGEALTDMVFASEKIRNFYTLAIAAAQSTPVHFRLRIVGPPRYHEVRWELLRDPANREHPVATSRNVLFSRYLSGPDWRPVPMKPTHEPRALIVIADPAGLDQYPQRGRQFEPVQVDVELARAQDALAHYRLAVLAGPDNKPSLSNVVARLNEGFDILYLVAHGALTDDVPLIFLERDDGGAEPVDARRLVERVRDLEHRPTVVLLSSCQSAGAGTEPRSRDEGALAGLGPRLVSAGVAAVVAMQGNVTMRTASVFAPAFFKAFLQDGVVDRAMAVARDTVRDRPDWWVPVLFSCLHHGQTYYVAQFSDAQRAAGAWDNLKAMTNGAPARLTPVLGPGLADGILGSRREIALRWVRRWHMPIAEHARGDLARVAQYLRVGRNPARVSAELQQYLRTELRERRRDAQGEDPFHHLPDGLFEEDPPEKVIRPEAVIEAVGRVLRERDPADPYRVIAALPVSVFVTTGWTDLLQDALRARGKVPDTHSFRWTDRSGPGERRRKVLQPTVGAPLVYHLFGRLDDPNSLVLTEDDYFEWLTAWIGDEKNKIPGAVRVALSNSSLLFLGYRLDDWDFRVVFQSIKSFAGGVKTRNYKHIGVQLKPENQLIEPESAQRYLESYFSEDLVDIYWADTRAFLDELRECTGITP